MRMLKQAVRLALAASAVVAGSIAVAGPANAVATPAEVCGSNYHEIDHHNLKGGVIHLLYNGTKNCVVSEKTAKRGTPTYTSAMIDTVNHNHPVEDSGNYKYYAGPVQVEAAGKCIVWGGQLDEKYDMWFNLQPSHCG